MSTWEVLNRPVKRALRLVNCLEPQQAAPAAGSTSRHRRRRLFQLLTTLLAMIVFIGCHRPLPRPGHPPAPVAQIGIHR
jgi:hypothetical protein